MGCGMNSRFNCSAQFELNLWAHINIEKNFKKKAHSTSVLFCLVGLAGIEPATRGL